MLRVPCPGRYRYLLESENRFTGASSTVTATVLLSARPGGAASARCGTAPPPRAGTALVAIVGAEEPLRLVGSRGAAGPFRGQLTLGTEPQCGESYLFEFGLDLRGWRRTVVYRMDVLAVTVAIQGRDEPRLGC